MRYWKHPDGHLEACSNDFNEPPGFEEIDQAAFEDLLPEPAPEPEPVDQLQVLTDQIFVLENQVKYQRDLIQELQEK